MGYLSFKELRGLALCNGNNSYQNYGKFAMFISIMVNFISFEIITQGEAGG